MPDCFFGSFGGVAAVADVVVPIMVRVVAASIAAPTAPTEQRTERLIFTTSPKRRASNGLPFVTVALRSVTKVADVSPGRLSHCWSKQVSSEHCDGVGPGQRGRAGRGPALVTFSAIEP